MSRLPDVATPHPDEILEMKKDEGSGEFEWWNEMPGSFSWGPEEVQRALDWLDERGVSRRDVWNYTVNVVGSEFPMQYADWFLKEMPVQQFVEWNFNETNARKIIENLDRYEGLDHDALFASILERGLGKLIVNDLEKFHVKDMDSAIVRMGDEGLFQNLVEREDADKIFGLNRLAKIALEHGGERAFLQSLRQQESVPVLSDEVLQGLAQWVVDNKKTINLSAAGNVGSQFHRLLNDRVLRGQGGSDQKELPEALAFYAGLPEQVSIGAVGNVVTDEALIKRMHKQAKREVEETGEPIDVVEDRWFGPYPELRLMDRLRLPEAGKFLFFQTQESRDLIEKVWHRGNRRPMLARVRREDLRDKRGQLSPGNRRLLLDLTLDVVPERLTKTNGQAGTCGDEVSELEESERSAFVDRWIEKDAVGAGFTYLKNEGYRTGFALTDAQRKRIAIAALEQHDAEAFFSPSRSSGSMDESPYVRFREEFLEGEEARRVLTWLLDHRPGDVGAYHKLIERIPESDDLFERIIHVGFVHDFEHAVGWLGGKPYSVKSLEPPTVSPEAFRTGIENFLKETGSLERLELKVRDLEQLKSTKRFDGKIPSLDHPWIMAIQKLKKIQARSAREDLDPWKQELEPLLQYALIGRIPPLVLIKNLPDLIGWGVKKPKKTDEVREAFLSPESAEDAEILVEFVKEFGMMNTPRLFEAYMWLKRAKKKEDIPEIVAKRIASFIGERRYDKLGQPHVILNDLRRSRRSMTTRMLEDELPYGLGTEIGDEVFNAVRGSTKWEQKGDNPKLLADMWREFVRERPDRARVPDGYQEVELQVAQRRGRGDSPEVAQKKEEVIKTDVIKDIVLKYSEIVSFGGSRASLITELERGFNNLRKNYEVKLDRLNRRIEKVREPESVARIKTRQVELQGQMTEMKALQALLPPDMEYTGDIGNNFTLLMEELSHFKDDRIVLEMIGWLSYAHMSDIQDRWRIDEYKEDTEQSLRDMDAFLQSYVFEHYLHSEQDATHTGHNPFSPELLEMLNQIWMRPEDGSEHPLRRAVQQLDEIGKGHLDSRKKTSIAMVPDQGLLRVVSGDTGNACYTSQHRQLATGEYPELHAYTFVTGRDTAQERFVGSVLFVEGEANDSTFGKGKTLIVRGNNPRENLIQSVDGEELIRQTLEEAIATAERRGIEYVAVPFDPASASSSNRPAVADTYRKWFANCPRIQLKETPETKFNGYDNWDPNGDYPLVVIWSKERGKIGNWPT